MKVICPNWLFCKLQGFVCYHDHLHYPTRSCKVPTLKSRFTVNEREDSSWCEDIGWKCIPMCEDHPKEEK